MGIDILNIQPNKVSTNARSYSQLLVGPPKIGKSTFMQELMGPKTLFIATEKRFGAMDGAYIAYVSDWTEFIVVLGQLKDPRVHEMYDSVVVDTLDNLGRYCDDFIASQFEESVIGEKTKIFGADYNRAEVVWEQAMKKLENSGFTYSAVVHDKEVIQEIPLNSLTPEERDKISRDDVKDGVLTVHKRVADLPNRYNKHIEKSFDNVVFVDYGVNQAGKNVRVLYLRGGLHNGAKVTLQNVPDVIPFTVKDLQETFKKSLSTYKNKTKTRQSHGDIKDAEYDYEKLFKEVTDISRKFVELGKEADAKQVVSDTLGKDVKVGELTPDRVKELALVVSALNDKLKSY